MSARKCNDCTQFNTRDVFKGFCNFKDKEVVIDTDAVDCSAYDQTGKCGFCTNYKSGEGPGYSKGALGECSVQSTRVYSELKACSSFLAS